MNRGPAPLSSTGAATRPWSSPAASLTDEQIARWSSIRSRSRSPSTTATPELQRPDAVYACDYLWWKLNHMKAKQNIPRRQLWTQDRAAAEQFQLSHIQWEVDGLGKRGLRVNGNSGAGAINRRTTLARAVSCWWVWT